MELGNSLKVALTPAQAKSSTQNLMAIENLLQNPRASALDLNGKAGGSSMVLNSISKQRDMAVVGSRNFQVRASSAATFSSDALAAANANGLASAHSNHSMTFGSSKNELNSNAKLNRSGSIGGMEANADASAAPDEPGNNEENENAGTGAAKKKRINSGGRKGSGSAGQNRRRSNNSASKDSAARRKSNAALSSSSRPQSGRGVGRKSSQGPNQTVELNDRVSVSPTSRRGSRRVPLSIDESNSGADITDPEVNDFDTTNNDDFHDSEEYRTLTTRISQLEYRLSLRESELATAKEEFNELLRAQENERLKNAIKQLDGKIVAETSRPNTGFKGAATAAAEASEHQRHNLAKANNYHKLKLLFQLGEYGKSFQNNASGVRSDRYATNFPTAELRWLLQMANEKNTENEQLRTTIAQLQKDREQGERTLQQKIDALTANLNRLSDRCVQEKAQADKWYQRSEFYREKLERIVWQRGENEKYERAREAELEVNSHLVNGLRVIAAQVDMNGKREEEDSERLPVVTVNLRTGQSILPSPDEESRYIKLRKTLHRLKVV